MKKLVVFIIFTIFTSNSFSNPIVSADTLRIDGKLVLWLRADNYGNGWNYGYFLGNRIMSLFDNYVIPTAFGGATNYNMARQAFDQYFIVDEKYNELAQGIVDGIEQSGVSLFSQILNDNLGFKDLLIANSIPDFTAMDDSWKDIGPGCSNLTSWGEATINDPELLGETVISRNLDWTNNPNLINNAIIIVWAPTGPDEQRWVSFGFIGLFGALSGFNESGVATFQNMSNYVSSATGTGFYPVNLAQRNGLEKADYNLDGICSPRDVSDAVRAHPVSSSFIIHSAGPMSLEFPAEILEIHNSFGDTIRTKLNNPEYFGDNLVATNHFRLLKPPAYCVRYQRISDSLTTSNQLSILRNWSVLKTAGVSINLQTIQFVPNKNIVRFSFAEIGTPAYQIEPTEISTGTLFSLVGIDEIKNSASVEISISPNPCKNLVSITAKFETPTSFTCQITDISGKIIKGFEKLNPTEKQMSVGWGTENIANGIYFCTIGFIDPLTGNFIRETQKIVVSK